MAKQMTPEDAKNVTREELTEVNLADVNDGQVYDVLRGRIQSAKNSGGDLTVTADQFEELVSSPAADQKRRNASL